MQILRRIIAKRFYLYALGALVTTAALVGNGANSALISAQGTNSMYLSPASGSFTVGSTVNMAVRINVSTDVNAVQADITFPTNLLQFSSIDGSSSAFSIDATSAASGGTIKISRGNINTVKGDQLVAKINFKALAAGSASVQFANTSVAVNPSSNNNVINTRSGGTYTLTGASTPTPTPTPTPPVSPGGGGITTPPASSGPRTSSNAAVTIAPNGNPSPTNLPGNSVVELSTPATLETTPQPNKTVTKVEYFLNGKPVATVSTPPYQYTIDTQKLRNGTYTVMTKTHYKDGKVDSTSSSIVVKNPFGVTQALLQLRHFAWLVALLALVGGELVYLRFYKHRIPNSPYNHMPVTVGAGPVGGSPLASAHFAPPTPIVPGRTPTTGTTTVEPNKPITSHASDDDHKISHSS